MGAKARTKEEIFNEAAVLTDATERAAFLRKACGEDKVLQHEIEQLLKHDDAQDSLLDRSAPGFGLTIDDPITERPGAVIGHYKLLEQIGEGGFGVVFMAEQTEPVKRKVALKILKPGMDTKQVVARFEAERQALALMGHPNIAHVYDAGVVGPVCRTGSEAVAIDDTPGPARQAGPTGRPYFVMELVKGIPITEYCDDKKLDTRERLQLFLQVCRAVQHAHQKGIIHRDIKPNNVLVTPHDGIPVVKVIDFGIAKAMSGQLTDITVFTGFAQMIGTPLYMSPEQAEINALDVDTRSDIYSLGVLMYELLTGTTPFDQETLKKAGYDEIRRIIREDEPPKPSARISTMGKLATTRSEQRKSDPRKLIQSLRGELDWIVMKSLEKDRQRRYETANAFADDVDRYLNNDPVHACPPSIWYRARKFARRQKTALAFVAVLVLFLTTLAVGIGWAVGERNARLHAAEIRARQTLNDAEATFQAKDWRGADSAVSRLEGMVVPGETSPSVRREVQQMRKDLKMVERLREIRLLRSETTAEGRGSFKFRKSAAEYPRAFRDYGLDFAMMSDEQIAERIRSSRIRGELIAALDDWAAVVVPKRTLKVANLADDDSFRKRLRRTIEAGDRESLLEIARSDEIGKWPLQTVLLLTHQLKSTEKHELIADILGAAHRSHPDDFWLNHELARTLQEMGPSHLDEATGYYRAAVALQPKSAGVRWNFGYALKQGKRYHEAVVEFQEALRLNPSLGMVHQLLGQTYVNLGKAEQAIRHLREAIDLLPESEGDYYSLGVALNEAGQVEAAMAAYRKAIQLDKENSRAWNNLGILLSRISQFDKAKVAYENAIRIDPKDPRPHNGLANAWMKQQQYKKAADEYRKAIDLEPTFCSAHFSLGQSLLARGKYEKAAESLQTAIDCYDKGAERERPFLADVYYKLGLALQAKGDNDEAIEGYRQAIQFYNNTPKTNVAKLAEVRNQLGTLLCQHEKDYKVGAIEFREAIMLDPSNPIYHFHLGNALIVQEKLLEAEKAYRSVIPLLSKTGTNQPQLALETYRSLSEVLVGLRKLSEAIEMLRKAIKIDPKDASLLNNLAWYLATAKDLKLRDPKESLALARKAVQLAPKNGLHHGTLGVAHYRNGNWQAAIDALNKSMEVTNGGTAFNWLFLGMAHWQLGDEENAGKWHDKAVQWMQKHPSKNEELLRFRAEGEKLIANKQSKSTKGNPQS